MRVYIGNKAMVDNLHNGNFCCNIKVDNVILSDLIKNGFNVEYWEEKNNCKVIVLDEVKK